MSANLTLRVVDDLNGEVFGDQARTGVAAGGSFDEGFNFRGTFDYVTDPADTVYVLAADNYPVTRGGVTFGWVITDRIITQADRSTGVDARIAGNADAEGTSGVLTRPYFRVDILAGTYSIYMSLGHPVTFTTSGMELEVTDTSTSKFTIGPVGTAAGHVVDANGTDHLATDWPANQTARTGISFATTQFRLHLGSPTTSASTELGHLRLLKTG